MKPADIVGQTFKNMTIDIELFKTERNKIYSLLTTNTVADEKLLNKVMAR